MSAIGLRKSALKTPESTSDKNIFNLFFSPRALRLTTLDYDSLRRG
jgi:hypothetical protein